MKYLSFCLLFVFTYSCVPLRIAPTIKTEKIISARKFKRKLPRDYAFIFEDPKDANEFYNYINTKFQLNHIDVDANVLININDNSYYLSFIETEIQTKTLNLVPIIVDGKRENNGNDPMFEDAYVSRKGNWYIVLTIHNDAMEDCLHPNYSKRKKVIEYLKNLKQEYLNTQNYHDALLKRKP